MALGETIKKLAAAGEDSATPAAFLFGEVLEVDPLKVQVDSRFTLSETFLVLPDHLRDGGIEPGDQLVLLRNRGGGQYLIMGKVGRYGNADTRK